MCGSDDERDTLWKLIQSFTWQPLSTTSPPRTELATAVTGGILCIVSVNNEMSLHHGFAANGTRSFVIRVYQPPLRVLSLRVLDYVVPPAIVVIIMICYLTCTDCRWTCPLFTVCVPLLKGLESGRSHAAVELCGPCFTSSSKFFETARERTTNAAETKNLRKLRRENTRIRFHFNPVSWKPFRFCARSIKTTRSSLCYSLVRPSSLFVFGWF